MDEQSLSARREAIGVYVNGARSQVAAAIQQEAAAYAPELDRLFDYHLFMSYVAEQWGTEAEPRAPLILYIRGAACVRAIHAVVASGVLPEAFVLVRALFEVRVALAAIMKDPVPRSGLYEGFEHIGRYEALCDARKRADRGELRRSIFEQWYPEPRIREIEARYNSVKADYHPTKPYHWAWQLFPATARRNPSLRQLCTEAGIEKEYDQAYGTYSMAAHAASISRRFSTTGTGTITMGPVFDWRGSGALASAMFYCHRMLGSLAPYFASSLHEELMILSAERALPAASPWLGGQDGAC